MIEMAAFRGALRDSYTTGTFLQVSEVLGFVPQPSPINYVGDPTSAITKRLGGIVSGLFREGSYATATGNAGLWIAKLDNWGVRSADRDRPRRRISKTLVECAPAGDRRFLIALTADKEDELELILPRQREDRSLGTVRATIRRSDPNHYHLELLRDLAIQPLESLGTLSRRWNEAFSVETVAKRFYLEFRMLRNRILSELNTSNRREPLISQNPEPAMVRRYVTKNLGRILFLWFLQSKGWLDGDRSYLPNLYERRCRNDAGHNFFRDTLIPLFFEALAKKPSQRSPEAKGLGAVPFLNGGLFLQTSYEDKLYGDDREHVQIQLSNELFDPRKHSDKSPTVFGLLKSYRFTTRESTPDDLSLDPDPELLGKVFENLNEPDERASSGTFYTPREIVRFMCQQTLDAYLKEKTGCDQQTLDWLRQEALDPEISNRHLPQKESQSLKNALDSVTVCDPAVGSGAFPVGMMHEILELKKGLEQSDDVTVDSGGQRVAQWKEQIITNCLYGVDINPEAAEICHLRLWLSLVIDANEPVPLPNLDFRFVAGDSLVDRIGTDALPESLPRQERTQKLAMGALEELPALEAQIRELRQEYVNVDKPSKARELRYRIQSLQIKAIQLQIDSQIENYQESLNEAKRKLAQRERYAAKQKEVKPLQKEIAALETELSTLRAMRASLDPRASSKKPLLWPVEFPEVFEKGGFHIVVANPPYVRQESLDPFDQRSYEAAFPNTYAGTGDLYVSFYERAYQLLMDGGQLAFITSNKYMRASYGERLREFLGTKLTVSHVIDFGDLPIFDAAAYPAIVVGCKLRPSDNAHCITGDLNLLLRRRIAKIGGAGVNVGTVREQLGNLPKDVAEGCIQSFPQVLLRKKGWILENPTLITIFDRLMTIGKPLGDFVEGRIYRGLITGLNAAFVIDEDTKRELIRADKNSPDLIKPWLRGKDIKRWKPEWQGLYIIAIQSSGDQGSQNPWRHARTEKEARAIFRSKYPAIHDYLSQYEEFPDPKNPRQRIGLRPRADQGRFWWELRACAYYDEFKKPKIIWPDISTEPTFAWDEAGNYLANTAYILTTDSFWLCAVLNSMPLRFCFMQISTTIQGGYFRLFDQYVRQLPIVVPPPPIRGQLENLVHKAMMTGDERQLCNVHEQIENIVGSYYGLTDSELRLLKDWFSQRMLVTAGGGAVDDD